MWKSVDHFCFLYLSEVQKVFVQIPDMNVKVMKRGAMEDNVNLLTSGIGMAGIDAAVKPIARKVRKTCKIFFFFFLVMVLIMITNVL